MGGSSRSASMVASKRSAICWARRSRACFHLSDPSADFLACGIVQPLEASAELEVPGKGTLQFGGNYHNAWFGIGLQPELGHRAGGDFAAFLHLLIYQHHVPALTRGKERGAKRKTVDLAFHLQPLSGSPNPGNIQRDVNDHPVKPRLKAFERGTKGFSER